MNVSRRRCAGLDAIWPVLRQTRLKPVSVHLDTLVFTRNRDKLPAALEAAVQRGMATRSPKREKNRAAMAGVSAIPGASSRAPRSSASAASIALR